MAAVKELIRSEANGTLSFGDYTLSAKTKKDGFEFQGDLYKVKTFSEITKLEKNGSFLYESVPGTAVENFKEDEGLVQFVVSGDENTQITIGVDENSTYEVYLNSVDVGDIASGISAKLNISAELGNGSVEVKVVKK